MFRLFKKEPIKFPELKVGDWVYFKEEDYWEEPRGKKTGFSQLSIAYIHFRVDKPYRVCFIESNGGYFIEADSLILHVIYRDCIDRIAEREKCND